MPIRPKLGKNIDQIGEETTSLDWSQITGDPTDNADLVDYLEENYVQQSAPDSGVILGNDAEASINYGARRLFYNNSLFTVDWFQAQLANGGGVALDWAALELLGEWSVNNDFQIVSTTKGLVLWDRTLLAYYRVFLDNGVIDVEAV